MANGLTLPDVEQLRHYPRGYHTTPSLRAVVVLAWQSRKIIKKIL